MGQPHQEILINKIRDQLLSWKILDQKNHILVALSGGMDSMVLLNSLIILRNELDLLISAAYIDHNVRKESKDDLIFLKNYCNSKKIPFYSKELITSVKTPGESPEEWMRNERYICLEAIRTKINAHWIATGHHADDQVETILFRLSQGSGIKGLQGIIPVRGKIIRPILKLSRDDIVSWIKENNIPFIEDKTNLDIEIPRNFLRHEILKPWKNKFDGVITGINRSVDHLHEIQDSLLFWQSELIKKIETFDEESYSINRNWYDELPDFMRAQLIFKLAADNKFLRKYEWNNLKSFLKTSSIGDMLEIGNNWVLLNERKNWIISQNFYPENRSMKVNSGVAIDIGNYVFTTSMEKDKPLLGQSPKAEVVDADKINLSNLVIRPWNPGDSFIPLGMTSSKKISDFLTDVKMSRWKKERQFVLTSNESIIWVCGQRISDTVKITDKTKNYLKLSLAQKAT